MLLNGSNIVYNANNNRVEVSKTPAEIKYLDMNIVKNKEKEIIEIGTEYLKIDSNTSKEIDENIYLMKINYLTNIFKDISVNGKNNLSPKWEDLNGYKLIQDVISDCCKNA